MNLNFDILELPNIEKIKLWKEGNKERKLYE